MLRFLLASFFILMLNFQAETPIEIITKAENKLKGKSSKSEMTMQIVRKSWTREIGLTAWTKDDSKSVILIKSPARDKGTAFLRIDKEIWNWQPKIDRIIKLPPSMMAQSWMGSDFTNDDMVQQSSLIKDFTHKLLEKQEVNDYDCHVIELTPKEDAAVVWGKIIMWISTKEYLQLKTEFYDEDDFLINTVYGTDIKLMDGVLLPTLIEIIPDENPEQRTIIKYTFLDINIPLDERFFSVQNLKRLK